MRATRGMAWENARTAGAKMKSAAGARVNKRPPPFWIPAFAGMTGERRAGMKPPAPPPYRLAARAAALPPSRLRRHRVNQLRAERYGD